MKYRIFSDRVKLIDSYLVPKRKMDRELVGIRNLHPTCEVFERSFRSLKAEWLCHNAAYALGIARSKTKDADLNFYLPWIVKAAYWLVGALAWPFIK